MIKKLGFLNLFFLSMLICACSHSTVFNVPVCQWRNMTSGEKMTTIETYQHQQNIKAQSSPNIFRDPIKPDPKFNKCY